MTTNTFAAKLAGQHNETTYRITVVDNDRSVDTFYSHTTPRFSENFVCIADRDKPAADLFIGVRSIYRIIVEAEQ